MITAFFHSKNGNCPMRKFLGSLSSKNRSDTIHRIQLLEKYGKKLREPFSKKLTEELLELRITGVDNIVRVIYFFIKENKAILTHGFIKKTQKTPINEIRKALQYKKEYEEQTKEEK